MAVRNLNPAVLQLHHGMIKSAFSLLIKYLVVWSVENVDFK